MTKDYLIFFIDREVEYSRFEDANYKERQKIVLFKVIKRD